MFDAIPLPTTGGASPPSGADPALPGMPAAPDMEALLRDFAAQNPRLAWLPQMLMAQRQAAAIAEPVPDPREDEIAALHAALAEAETRARRLQHLAKRLAHALEGARERLTDLACAFGACGLCWGEDAHCPSCRGHGGPGRFPPDPELGQRLFAQPLPAPAPRVPNYPEPMKGDEP